MYVPVENFQHCDAYLLIALICKSGRTSLRKCSNGWDISNELSLEYPNRVFFIRNPIKRLRSCYSFIKTLKIKSINCSDFDFEATLTWQEFVDHVLAGNKNPHWNNQVESLYFNGELTPNIILRFEELHDWWPKYTPCELRHLNSSIPQETPDYRNKELGIYYAPDFDQWNKATLYSEDAKVWL